MMEHPGHEDQVQAVWRESCVICESQYGFYVGYTLSPATFLQILDGSCVYIIGVYLSGIAYSGGEVNSNPAPAGADFTNDKARPYADQVLYLLWRLNGVSLLLAGLRKPA